MSKEMVAARECGHGNPQSPSLANMVEVWEDNFLVEMRRVRELVQDYPFVAFVSCCSVPLCADSVPHNVNIADHAHNLN
jgi:hypothetical protein